MRLSWTLCAYLSSLLFSFVHPASANPHNGIHVPLRRRTTASLRQNDGDKSDLVDMNALHRTLRHVESRYGEAALKKRLETDSATKRGLDIFQQEEDEAHKVIDEVKSLFTNGLSSHGILSKQPDDDMTNALDEDDNEVESTISIDSQDGRAADSSSSPLAVKDSTLRFSNKINGKSGDQSESVGLRNSVKGNRDMEFTGEIKIGSPGTSFWLDPDSGSADIWTVSKACKGENCGPITRNRYSSKSSSTYSSIKNKVFNLKYGIGAVSGKFFRDNVAVGNLNIEKQTIGLADELSADWKDDDADGVLGLGFRAITSAKQRPFIQNLAAQNTLQDKVISFAFGRHVSGTEAKSEMRIGSTNDKLHKGDLSWYNLSKAGYWQFSIDSFASGSSKGVQGVDAIIDTGTSMIVMSKDQAETFWKGVKGSSLSSDGTYHTFPCKSKIDAQIKLPDNRIFQLSEDDLNLGKEELGSDKCIGSVLSSGTPGQIIFGLAALKNFYSVLDFGNERIGLATLAF